MDGAENLWLNPNKHYDITKSFKMNLPAKGWKHSEDKMEIRNASMQYLHTMVRVADLDAALDFYCAQLGLVEVKRMDNETGRFTLVFLAAPEDIAAVKANQAPLIELTYNWDPEDYPGGRNFGHLAYRVDDIYALCAHLQAAGTVINRPPRDGHMAFVRSPDGISIELLQKGEALAPAEPWASMENTGQW